LNPDICFQEDPFPELLKVLLDDKFGLVAPLILSPQGLIEDSARAFPRVLNILNKTIFGNKNSWPLISGQILYKPDWVAGMFLLLSTSKFKDIGGFDPRFFMYYEDVDLCHRFRKKGYEVAFLTSVSVTHNARRDSRKKLRFFLWHLKSVVRYLLRVY
jgi:GT2 family glycosyltransferase